MQIGEIIQSYFDYILFWYNISLEMSIRKIVGMQGGVEDFKLQVAPRTITLPKSAKCFILYLEKGMQVIGKFQSDEGTTLKDHFYRFSRRIPPASFYLSNLQHCNYTWSLYSINLQTNQQTFQDSSSFNIERTIKLYQMQLLQKQREIQTSIKQKNINKKMIIDLWNQVKKEMKTYKSVLKCVFSNQDYQIQFQVEIKNILDFQTQKQEEDDQRNSMRRVRSEQNSIIHSNSSSEIKIKYPQNCLQQLNVIQLQSKPYNTSQQAINTQQTITYDENEPKESNNDLEDFNATVKIMNPKGEEIDADKHESAELGLSDGFIRVSHLPLKKFSMLSDIIQRSCEGSSSYGNPQKSSSNGAKYNNLRKDATIDLIIEQEEPLLQPFAFNKVRTLPYESHHHLEIRDEFRRAQTAEKNQSEAQSSQIQEESFISTNEQVITLQPQTTNLFSKLSQKWIIIIGIILLLGMVSATWGNSSPKKKPKRRGRN